MLMVSLVGASNVWIWKLKMICGELNTFFSITANEMYILTLLWVYYLILFDCYVSQLWIETAHK